MAQFSEQTRTSPITDGPLPLLVEPVDVSLRAPHAFAGWLADNEAAIRGALLHYGGVLLRGFAIGDADDFAQLAERFPTFELGYAGGATPRAAIKGKVFEASRILSHRHIMLHQEMAYLPHYPSKLAFFCRKTAAEGGETVIGDMRRLTSLLPRRLRDEIAARGVKHTRNFRTPELLGGRENPAFNHRTWQQAFYTEDRAEAEAACRAQGLSYAWLDDGSLSVVHSTPGFLDHPVTGDRIWFNHIASQVIHPRWMLDDFPAFHAVYGDDLPRPTDTRYGDGGRIADEDFELIHDLLDEITVAFPWQDGDIMILDNILTAHGRAPFSGERDVQVMLLA